METFTTSITDSIHQIVEIWPPLRIDWSNRTAAVKRLREQTSIAEELDELDPAVEEKYIKVPMRDGYENPLRIFKSKGSSTPGPLVVLYHGGGCIMGSPTMMAETARWLVKHFQALVVTPAYRLAPEHPFPAAINDAWDNFVWITQNYNIHPALQHSADPVQGFIIGGVSAGGNMSTIIAHQARDQNLLPRITGIYSACGSARHRGDDLSNLPGLYRDRFLSRSQPECIYNPILSKEMSDLMTACYQADTSSELFCPLLWPSEQGHRNLPRMYQQVCGRDPNRDEQLILDDLLKKAGIETRLDVYKGLPHCFWIALRHLPESTRWERETVEGFTWLLQR
ncbi:related to sterigmatocystin biosynthesis lipase esterase STCI [Lecanosticta acicola]|uniref:Related to sterigmatocystin biosynthesis lipase esterase STCI n=1 Tax=Lecanosticta acicola TaxID=111012 RepID=A0AAI8YY48_9PEZI|nr:related to sterigmatocystin biosynthesis lipase esterase STCI [Lecanosticta acicola]